MKKPSKEHPIIKADTPFDVETKISKEEIDSGKFDIKELEVLMAALLLLVNNGKNIGGGTLEIKTNPETKQETATVYRDSDHKPFFVTEDPLETMYLRDPERSLEILVTELDRRQASNKLIKNIQDNLLQTDKKS